MKDYLKTLDTDKARSDFIFQEARRLNIATFQAITYKEYLPLVLGPKLMKEYDLIVEDGKRSVYDSEFDPTMWHEFSTFAYRSHRLYC